MLNRNIAKDDSFADDPGKLRLQYSNHSRMKTDAAALLNSSS